jgi:Ring finger domain
MILAGLTLPRSSGASEISVLLSAHCIHSFLILEYSLIYYFAHLFTLVVLSTIFLSGYHGTGFGVNLSKLKSSANACAEWVAKGIRLCLKLLLATLNIFIIFDSRPRPSSPNGAGMIVSPQLSMQAEIAELRSPKKFLKSEQQRLESEIKGAEAWSREQERLIRQQQQQQQQHLRSSSGSQKYFDHTFAPPRQFSSSTHQSLTSSSSKASTSTLNPFGPDSRSAGSTSSRALGYFSKPPPPTPPSDRDDSILEAMRLQSEFDKEDCALSAQRAKLAKSTQRLFECGICMEEMPDDSIARPDPCGHAFCRECLRGHVAARINEHRFPILCPTCTAGKMKGKEAAGGMCCERTVNLVIISRYVSLEVSQSLALDLGLTNEQYSIWTEMEMVSFSVLLYCRKYVYGIRSPVPLLILR